MVRRCLYMMVVVSSFFGVTIVASEHDNEISYNNSDLFCYKEPTYTQWNYDNPVPPYYERNFYVQRNLVRALGVATGILGLSLFCPAALPMVGWGIKGKLLSMLSTAILGDFIVVHRTSKCSQEWAASEFSNTQCRDYQTIRTNNIYRSFLNSKKCTVSYGMKHYFLKPCIMTMLAAGCMHFTAAAIRDYLVLKGMPIIYKMGAMIDNMILFG